MKRLMVSRFRAVVLVTFLLAFAGLLYSCGGGETTTRTASVYITDDVTDAFDQVIVTIYKVEFVNAVDGSAVTVFDDSPGLTYDLSELSGVLDKLGTLPEGSYSSVRITVGKELILVDKTTGDVVKPTFGENAWTSCSDDGTCVIDISGAANVVSTERVVLDFDLKQFVYDPLTKTVTAKVVLDADGSDYDNYQEIKEDDYELKGIIQSFTTGGFDLTVLKAEGFIPDSNIITVSAGDTVQFTCDDDDERPICGISGISDLQVGMKVEVDGTWNGTEFAATKVEVDGDDDIVAAVCDLPDRSVTGFTGLTVQPDLESTAYTFDSGAYSLTVSGVTVLITQETRIEYETGDTDRIICADQLPVTSGKIEIEYYHALDSSGSAVNVAYKIDFEE
ncbi:hypothetical protein MNBD_NITROSPIRAE03-817 [hydrothermal vent metagenome]|uniref:DUF4382 domain-containing protein n=1 Tax=hydrothermal vent metagenome TaxID=652676 RepID=A0A3B1DCK2_9ZZZZ